MTNPNRSVSNDNNAHYGANVPAYERLYEENPDQERRNLDGVALARQILAEAKAQQTPQPDTHKES